MQRHILSFDVEEYFQVESARRGGVLPRSWRDWPSRVAGQVDRVLEVLAERNTTATFFLLGWVARREAGLVRRIADAGHEIASHGMTHRMLETLTPETFARELRASRRLLEDAAGQAVVGYRAPTFSVNHRTAWAFDVLAEQGFAYDSSVFPVRHDRYGVPDAPRVDAPRGDRRRGVDPGNPAADAPASPGVSGRPAEGGICGCFR